VARGAVRPSRVAPVPSNGADASTDAVDANIATERGVQWRPASVLPSGAHEKVGKPPHAQKAQSECAATQKIFVRRPSAALNATL
jgi:hypothetical protein